MPRIKHSVDKILRKAAEEAIEDAVERKTEEGFIAPEGEEKTDPTEQDQLIDHLLSTISRNEGYYFKLYKEISPGKFEYKEKIEDYEGWHDLENEVADFIRFHTKESPEKWGSGKYKLEVWQTGFSTPRRRPLVFNLDAGEKKEPPPPPSPTSDARQKITELSELIKSVQGLVSQDKIRPEEIHKMLGESFKAGLNAIPLLQQNQQPPPQKENGTNYLAIIAGVLPILKELGIIGQPKIDPQQIVKDTLSMLKDMGVIGKPQKDERQVLAENITMLKELGVLGVDREKVDTLSEIDKIKAVIEAVSGITGLRGDGGQPQSVALEVVKTLAPHIPGVIDKVTGTMNNMVDLQKQKISMAPIPSEPLPRRVALRPLPPTDKTETLQEEKVQQPKTPPQFFHPLLDEIYQAVQKNDTTKFTYIYDRLTKMFPGTQLNTTEEAFSILVNIGGEPFNNEKTLDYVTEFISFIKSQNVVPAIEEHEVETNKFEVVAVCPLCSAQFDFQSKEYFERLSAADRMCGERLSMDPSDICPGMLILEEKNKVKGNGSGGHAEGHVDMEEETLEQSVEEGVEEKV